MIPCIFPSPHNTIKGPEAWVCWSARSKICCNIVDTSIGSQQNR